MLKELRIDFHLTQKGLQTFSPLFAQIKYRFGCGRLESILSVGRELERCAPIHLIAFVSLWDGWW
jgi:hypothetical protein